MAAPSKQLADRLRQRIATGEWAPGTRIPSVTGFQREYGLGRGAIWLAIATLRREGLLEGRPGARLTVAYPPAVRTLTDPDADWPHGRGDTEVGVCRPSPELRERLQVTAGIRLHWSRAELLDPDDRPAMLLTTWQHGIRPHGYASVRWEVRPHALTAGEASLLGLATGATAFLLERTRFDAAGTPVQTADLVLPADRWRISGREEPTVR